MSDTRQSIEEISPEILPTALVRLFKKGEFKLNQMQSMARKESL